MDLNAQPCIELQTFKRSNGFTDKLGQCGFCLKQLSAIECLKRHKLRVHGGKSVKEEKSERKGVSFEFY